MHLRLQLRANLFVGLATMVRSATALQLASPNAKTMTKTHSFELASPVMDFHHSMPVETHHAFPNSVVIHHSSEQEKVTFSEEYRIQPNVRPERQERKTSFDKTKQRFLRRLNTHEDSTGIHKYSAAGWFITMLVILGTGTFHHFQEVPSWLEYPTWALVGFTTTQSVNGAGMAIKYRKGDPIAQRGMINMACGMLFSMYSQLFVSPIAPEALNKFWVGNGLMILGLMPSLIFTADEVMNLPERIKARGLRKREKAHMDLGVGGDAAFGIFMVLVPFVLAVWAIGSASDPSHDRSWILGSMFSSSAHIAENWYGSAFLNFAMGVGSFAITLRDKSLISKWAEQVLCVLPFLPSVVLTLQSQELLPPF